MKEDKPKAKLRLYRNGRVEARLDCPPQPFGTTEERTAAVALEGG